MGKSTRKRKKQKMKKLLFLLILFAFLPAAMAIEAQTTLLTVGQRGDELIGGTASLEVKVEPGQGRVYIDSFPLSQIDTQVTTRFSKNIACSTAGVDCSKYDFFYTIRAGSSLVGGPSGGASTTVLTLALLLDLDVRDDVVMTGTINSGGIIGPVSGVKEKALAAQISGYNTILIPAWTNTSGFEDLTIEVVEVANIEEALFYYTGHMFPQEDKILDVPQEYNQIMRGVATDLCERYLSVESELENYTRDLNFNRSVEAIELGDYYSAASYCYTAVVVARQVLFSTYSEEELNQTRELLRMQIEEFEREINRIPINTISDLETSMIVKERLFEARSLVDEGELAYVYERFNSAISWSAFFNYESEELRLNKGYLRNTCFTRLAEADERVSYLEYLAGTNNFRNQIEETRRISSEGDFAFCIFRATKIKSDVNSAILASTVPADQIENLARAKYSVAYRQAARNRFSIIGYSYLNYAGSLININPASSIGFSDYAAEFGNLDMYLESPGGSLLNLNRRTGFSINLDNVFFSGMLFGIAISLALILILARRPKKDKKPRKTRKRPPGKKR